jgi:hypothetical protein
MDGSVMMKPITMYNLICNKNNLHKDLKVTVATPSKSKADFLEIKEDKTKKKIYRQTSLMSVSVYLTTRGYFK